MDTINKHSYYLQKYSAIHTTRINQRGDGVSIYIHNLITFNKLDNLSLSIRDEYDMVSVNLSLYNTNILISGIYKSPSFNPLTAGGAEQRSGHFAEGARYREKYLTYNIIITYF